MTKNTVYRRVIDSLDENAYIIPDNKTLLVEQLTDKAPQKPELKKFRNIDEVFAHYQPELEVEFEDENGNFRREILKFKTLHDFGPDGLAHQSDFLKGIKEKNEALFNINIAKALKSTRNLEHAYLNTGIFFQNSNQENQQYFHIMNIARDSISDLYDRRFIHAVDQVLEEGYYKSDSGGNYSTLVIPGWMGSKQVLEIWGEMAHNHMVMLITDYRDMDLKSALRFLEKDRLAGSEIYLQHIVMTFNQVVSRKRAEYAGEKNDMHISAAAALAGLMYDTERLPVSVPRSGTKHGSVKGAIAVNQELADFETEGLDQRSLVPLISYNNSVFIWGGCTLYNGANIVLRDYALVKTIDWVAKVLMNIVGKTSLQQSTITYRNEIRVKIQNFLHDHMGSEKLIQHCNLMQILEDPETKNIIIDLEITPYSAAKNIHISLAGYNAENFDIDVQ